MGNGAPIWRGRKIRAAMEASGYTPTELAKAMGVDRQVVNAWTSTGRIGKERLPLLSKLLNKRPEYWLTQDAADQPALTEDDVTPEEAGLVLAFRDLTTEQQAQLLQDIRQRAADNRAIAAKFQMRKPTPPTTAVPRKRKPKK